MPTLAELRKIHFKPVTSLEKWPVRDSLVVDSRNHIRPTQYVEEKLQMALKRLATGTCK